MKVRCGGRGQVFDGWRPPRPRTGGDRDRRHNGCRGQDNLWRDGLAIEERGQRDGDEGLQQPPNSRSAVAMVDIAIGKLPGRSSVLHSRGGSRWSA